MDSEIKIFIKHLTQKIEEGTVLNNKTVFPNINDKKYVLDFLEKYIKKNNLIITGKNAINYYTKNDSKLKLPINLLSNNPESDIITISKKIASKYNMIISKKTNVGYIINWEGQYKPIIIINQKPNITFNKFVNIEYLLIDLFKDYLSPRNTLSEWKQNIEIENNLIQKLKLNINPRKINNNSNIVDILKLLENEKKYFISGLQQLKNEKFIKNVEYLDIFTLNSNTLIKKIKELFPKIKLNKKEKYLNYLPIYTEISLNNKLLAKIYDIDTCYTFNGKYSNIYCLLIILIINEPTLVGYGFKLYSKLNNNQKYNGECIGPLPEQLDRSKFKVLFSKKK